jgi:hypothetical protein
MDERLVAKIQKLLALGASEGPEAKSAMAKAGQLMAENDIGLEDISDGSLKEEGILEELVSLTSKNILVWEVTLAQTLCKAFDCRCLKQTSWSGDKRAFIGTKSDLKLLIWYYKFLRIKVAREAETKFRLVRDQKSFGYGAVQTLSYRIMDMFAAKQQAMTNDTKALVLVKTDAVEKFINSNYRITPGRRQTISNINGNAVSAGQEAGRNMSLNRPITGNKSATGAPMIGAG